ncbi:MAG: PfkB family carbohydrate kinase [Candidatus Hodarchaeota archaeon]
MKKNKILVLGSLAFDYIMTFEENFINAVSIDHQKQEYQSTVTAKSRTQYFGGTAGNIAYNLGLINIGNISLFGAVGKDFEKLGYKDHISKFKNIELAVDIHEDLFTAACYIVNDVKSNQMIIFHGGALDHCKEIDLRQKIQDPENYIYAINSTQSVEAMANFADQLFELNIPMIFDPGQVTPLFTKMILLDIIKKSEILIGNTYEINQVKNKSELSTNELLKYLKAIIVTKGSEGSELIYSDNIGHIYNVDIPIANPNNVKDTTGAGDGYRAGILSGLILDMTLLDSCRLGSIIGSFVVETNGAQTQKFNIQDVRKRFYKTYAYIPPELEGL